MAEPINFDEALADPPDLTPEPPRLPRRPRAPIPARDISDQLFAAIKAFELRDTFSSGGRDLESPVNDENFELIGDLKRSPSPDELDTEVNTSNISRDELGLDREDEDLFRQFRSPDISRLLATDYLVAMGLEQLFAETLRTF